VRRLRFRLGSPAGLKARIAIALTGLIGLLAGCGGSAPSTEEASSPAAPAPTGARELEIPADTPLASKDPAEWTYDDRVANILFLLDTYWANVLPQRFDTEYASPERIVAYDSDEGDPGCQGEPQGVGNAYYCEPDDLVAWDDAGLIQPLDADLGEDAMTFVLAHEWGHLVQARLGLLYEYPITVEKELAADCLAGDFFGALEEQVGMTDEEFNSVVSGLETFGDQEGVPWTDASAHGTPVERAEALDVGFSDGTEACLDEFPPGFSE
jgi:predicted metalloprotease